MAMVLPASRYDDQIYWLKKTYSRLSARARKKWPILHWRCVPAAEPVVQLLEPASNYQVSNFEVCSVCSYWFCPTKTRTSNGCVANTSKQVATPSAVKFKPRLLVSRSTNKGHHVERKPTVAGKVSLISEFTASAWIYLC
jgi:hypothetical protein